MANDVRLEWLTADAGYGEVPALLFRFDDRGQETHLVRAAEIITLTQDSLAHSRRSHVKTKRRRLRELGIELSVLRCCILGT